MKEVRNNCTDILENDINHSCGNCWGHQEYTDGYASKLVDVTRGKKDNFLSRFVKKYLSK